MTQPLDYIRKKPRQTRGILTVEVILEAAVQVLDARGYEATTTYHIAERAGVSVGTLYQYFSNKEEIVSAMLLSYRRELEQEVIQALETTSIDTAHETVRNVVSALIQSYRKRAHARSFVVQTKFASTQVKPGESELGQILTSKLKDMARIDGRNTESDSAAVDSFVLLSAILGVAHNAVIHDVELLEKKELEIQLVRLVNGFLGTQIPNQQANKKGAE